MFTLLTSFLRSEVCLKDVFLWKVLPLAVSPLLPYTHSGLVFTSVVAFHMVVPLLVRGRNFSLSLPILGSY